MQHQNDPSSQPAELAGHELKRDLPAWLGIALSVAAWTWIQPKYVPVLGGTTAGIVLAFLGALLLFIAGARRGRAALGLALGVGAVLLLGSLDYFFSWIEAARQPTVPPFSWMAWLAAQAMGLNSAVQGGQLILNESQGAFTYAPTWGLVAFRSLLLFWALGAVFIGVRDRALAFGALSRLILVPVAFFGVRYAALVLSVSSADDALASKSSPAIGAFWQPESVVAVLLASAFALAALDKPLGWAKSGSKLFAMRAAGFAAVAGLALGSAFTWNDPGTTKAGRVLVDDRLTGIWEPAGRLLDTERYGDFSTYSLAAMVENLSRRFSVTVNDDRLYTQDYLKDFDVLVLKTPDQPLTPQEVQDIQAWVLEGGGLFAISDHTDLNGMSTHLNQVIGMFGFMFQFDATASIPKEGGFDEWNDPFIPEHPISNGLSMFECMTPCSIKLSKGARPVLTMEMSMATAGDYAGSSHFGGLAPDPGRAHGMLLLAGAAEWDAGRVLAFSDSTVLSSFAYYTHSHSDFILRGVAWLNREGSVWYWLRWVLTGLGLVLAFLSIRLLFPPAGSESAGPGGLALAVALAGLGFGLGAKASGELSAAALTVPDATDDNLRVGFVTEGGHAWTPAVLGTQPDIPDDGNLMTFIQTPQRLGYETRIVARDPAVLETLDVLVLLNPGLEEAYLPEGGEAADIPPTREWLDAVDEWVDEGGRLVVVARRQHLGHEHEQAPLYLREDLEWHEHATGVEGISVSFAPQGEGRVVSIVGAEEFDLQSMGHCMQFPGRSERSRYDVAFWVFGEIVGLPLPERRSYQPN